MEEQQQSPIVPQNYPLFAVLTSLGAVYCERVIGWYAGYEKRDNRPSAAAAIIATSDGLVGFELYDTYDTLAEAQHVAERLRSEAQAAARAVADKLDPVEARGVGREYGLDFADSDALRGLTYAEARAEAERIAVERQAVAR